ncbi:aspartyl-phosphate phosphatase Spo0E family protein [Paenibacillus flagellatus]|uniref:Aspartyl-phosphate phosphatase Spo0E family protein n=1 Tax=Paenibacillus flagellatus TaxID=2211139 RepID=A0A2V5JVR8_9BACL|nr:aspartyl-phosphate phosphatase Spo0E family protein [Paenibacillus flagellatus]PYI50718.1 aspartyl-phosphate phosphatase Spo0E family protein [Paenibacillus flagellatus]
MTLLSEIESLKRQLSKLADRHGDLTHNCVVRLSQLLDRKLNEYERLRRENRSEAGVR